jgi:hypothetical protein
MDIKAIKKYIEDNYHYSFVILDDKALNSVKACLIDDSGKENHDIWTINWFNSSKLITMSKDGDSDKIYLQPHPFAIFAIMYV